MDLNEVYTPRELTDKRVSFLESIMRSFQEIADLRECAKTIGHKLFGTGGNLGLTQYYFDAVRLEEMADNGANASEMKSLLDSLQRQVKSDLRRLQSEEVK